MEGRNREARVEPRRSLRRLRREMLVMRNDGRLGGEEARGNEHGRFLVSMETAHVFLEA